MQQLHDHNGQRKYLTPAEREAFLKAADAAEREVRTFCGVLVYTGCRISEALALTADRVDIEDGVIILESLKKRRAGSEYGSRPESGPEAPRPGRGVHASPKGLRHGFGIKAVTSNVPLNALQKWLGHAQISTTSIYADATGDEAKQLAERMWWTANLYV